MSDELQGTVEVLYCEQHVDQYLETVSGPRGVCTSRGFYVVYGGMRPLCALARES